MQPSDLIKSRKWRLIHSMGLLWPILSFGLLTCVVFTYRGIRMKRWIWLAYAAVFLVVSWISLFLVPPDEESSLSTVLSLVFISQWPAGILVAVFTNKIWLRWRATQVPWYAAGANYDAGEVGSPSVPLSSSSSSYQDSVDRDQLAHRDSPADRQGSTRESPQRDRVININSADPSQIADLGIASVDVANIVRNRNRKPFRSFDDIVSRSGVAPHTLLRVRNSLTFESRAHSSINDPENGVNSRSRRLDL